MDDDLLKKVEQMSIGWLDVLGVGQCNPVVSRCLERVGHPSYGGVDRETALCSMVVVLAAQNDELLADMSLPRGWKLDVDK